MALVPRSPRYALMLPMRYRHAGGEWGEGMTVNISRSGVLFQAISGLTVHSPIEMIVSLPNEARGGHRADAVCVGHVIRVSPPDGNGGAVEIGASIAGYELLPRAAGLSS